MNDILKQRLVGALVLIALGVAFWPVIFVESERVAIDRSSQVEPMPELEEVDIPAPQPLEDLEPVSVVDAMRADLQPGETVDGVDSKSSALAPESREEDASVSASGGSERVDSEAPESPSLDERGIPVAWVLQVASVSSRERADRLTAELIEAGYKAYHRPVEKGNSVLYRVFVGPVFEREKLAEAKPLIDDKFKVSAIIARYVP